MRVAVSFLMCDVIYQSAADSATGSGHEGTCPRQAVEPARSRDPSAPPQDRHPSLQGAQ